MPNDPLMEALAAPMRELLGRYRAAAAWMADAMQTLAAHLDAAPPAASPSPARPAAPHPPPRPAVATLQAESGDVETLLEFQERLSEIPGVLKVTVAGLKDGRSTFLVELAEEAQLVVCTSCGKTLVEGRPPASHGLCEDCRGSYGLTRG